MASQSNGLCFVVTGCDRTEHSRSSTMWSPIHEGLYPGPCGIRDGTEAHICMGQCFRGPGTWVGRVVHEQAGQLMAGRAVISIAHVWHSQGLEKGSAGRTDSRLSAQCHRPEILERAVAVTEVSTDS